jgi:hypothetical protein
MARKPNLDKYKHILHLLSKGESHREIQDLCSCSPNTIQKAIEWGQKTDSKLIKDNDNDNNNNNKVDDSPTFLKSSKSIENSPFGIRFYSWMARWKKISGYYDMSLSELKIAIGKQLIQEAKNDNKCN